MDKQQELDWRRDIVLKRLAQGKTQKEISKELQVHPSTISLDVQFLREQAKKELETHIQEKIPLEYVTCREGFRKILEIGNNIIDKPDLDDKTRLQALQTLAGIYKMIMDLTADGVIVEVALKKIERLQRVKTAAELTGLSEEDRKKLEDGEIITIDEFENEKDEEEEQT